MLAYMVDRALGSGMEGAGPAAAEALRAGRGAEELSWRDEGLWLGHRSRVPLTAHYIWRLLLAGQDVEAIARMCDIRVDAVRAALRDTAAHPDAPKEFSSVLELIAAGSSRAEAAMELGMSQDQLSDALEPLRPPALQQKLEHAVQALAAVRPLEGSPAAQGFISAGSRAPSGQQQMLPVRFPEQQYKRLKEWCATNGFPMAAVVRGLVERFLDEQDRRAA